MVFTFNYMSHRLQGIYVGNQVKKTYNSYFIIGGRQQTNKKRLYELIVFLFFF